MNCKDIQNNILFYIDKELDNMKSQHFEKHLEICPKCKLLFENILKTYSFADNKITETNPFFYTRVKAAIESEKNKKWKLSLKHVPNIIVQTTAYVLIGLSALFIGHFLANGENYIDEEAIVEPIEKTDEEIFADSHFLTLSTQDFYIINVEEVEE